MEESKTDSPQAPVAPPEAEVVVERPEAAAEAAAVAQAKVAASLGARSVLAGREVSRD
jgi:hypothetical protein